MGAWVFTPCTIVSALPSFWRTCCLHLLRDWIFSYGFVTKKNTLYYKVWKPGRLSFEQNSV